MEWEHERKSGEWSGFSLRKKTTKHSLKRLMRLFAHQKWDKELDYGSLVECYNGYERSEYWVFHTETDTGDSEVLHDLFYAIRSSLK